MSDDINEIIAELNSKEAGAQKVIADLQRRLDEANKQLQEYKDVLSKSSKFLGFSQTVDFGIAPESFLQQVELLRNDPIKQ